jgi:hypothetical protein
MFTLIKNSHYIYDFEKYIARTQFVIAPLVIHGQFHLNYIFAKVTGRHHVYGWAGLRVHSAQHGNGNRVVLETVFCGIFLASL